MEVPWRFTPKTEATLCAFMHAGGGNYTVWSTYGRLHLVRYSYRLCHMAGALSVRVSYGAVKGSVVFNVKHANPTMCTVFSRPGQWELTGFLLTSVKFIRLFCRSTEINNYIFSYQLL